MTLIEGIINNFHEIYYSSRVWLMATTWMGVPVLKTPLDLWVYQEIIYCNKPDIIIETGTGFGGTTLFMDTICQMVGKGLVITIDKCMRMEMRENGRIVAITGDSVSDEVVNKVKAHIRPEHKVMVILDSDHKKNHVLKELEIYGQLVTPGCHLIVEDTNVNGHPVEPGWGEGPMEALQEWVQKDPNAQNFERDTNAQKFGLTFNPNGYLLRVK